MHNQSATFQYVIDAAFLLLIAVLSICYQGFDYGIINNASHVSIILRHQDVLNFPNNPFIDALRNYCTWVWPLLSQLRPDADWAAVFLVCHLLCRWLTLLGLYVMLRALVPASAHGLALVGIVVLPFSNLLYGNSPVARSDMFIGYFNQTELALGFIFIAYACLWQRKDTAAFAIAGLAFNINVFVATWAAVVLTAAVACRLRAHENVTLRRTLMPLVAIYIVTALPTILWVVDILAHTHRFRTYDYKDFLLIFFPYHYFIEFSEPARIVRLSLAIATGVLSLRLLGLRRNEAAVTLGSHYLLFAVGAALPLVTTIKSLMDLQLMRTESIFTVMAVLLCVAVTLQRLHQARAAAEKSVLLAALISLTMGFWPGAVCALVCTAVHERAFGRHSRVIGCLIIATMAAVVAKYGIRHLSGSLFNYPQLAGMAVLLASAFVAIALRSGFVLVIAAAISLNAFETQAAISLNPFGISTASTIITLLAMAWFNPDENQTRPLKTLALLATLLIFGLSMAHVQATIAAVGPSRQMYLVSTLEAHAPVLWIISILIGLFVIGASIRKAAWIRRAELVGNRPSLVLSIHLCLLLIPPGTSIFKDRIKAGDISNAVASQREFRNLGAWIDSHLARDANVVVLMDLEEFPVYAKRNVYFSRKYGDGVVCDPALYYEFKRRLENLSRFVDPDTRKLVRPVGALEAELIAFARHEGITHILSPRSSSMQVEQLKAIWDGRLLRLFEVPYDTLVGSSRPEQFRGTTTASSNRRPQHL